MQKTQIMLQNYKKIFTYATFSAFFYTKSVFCKLYLTFFTLQSNPSNKQLVHFT